ncbi:hypothetical protein SDC9_103830 [bioreactor metagenome]|uniref:Uncharacterized protein n=1 Tax=bioreactor metagenome TaxID=1076179 RepID=A0A645B1G7_9ZZZZ
MYGNFICRHCLQICGQVITEIIQMHTDIGSKPGRINVLFNIYHNCSRSFHLVNSRIYNSINLLVNFFFTEKASQNTYAFTGKSTLF